MGDRPPQASLQGKKPEGYWRRYHPVVCKRLEREWQTNLRFFECRTPTDVDGVRYVLQRITEENPFNYAGTVHHGKRFTEDLAITIDHPCYEDLDRVNENCLVQCHKDDPTLRRPARRITNAEEIARNAARTGDPCFVCYSEEGQLTGCPSAHVICGDCLRAALRSLAGDILVIDKLVCGCFAYEQRLTVMELAKRADAALQEKLATPPANKFEAMERAAELEETCRRFDLGEGAQPCATLYEEKVEAWFRKVLLTKLAPKYHVCQSPECAGKLENWMLRTDFNRDYRAKGKNKWTCADGHQNEEDDGSEDLKLLQDLGYQRCPRCGEGAELAAGCKYVYCKCGGHFCYHCGRNLPHNEQHFSHWIDGPFGKMCLGGKMDPKGFLGECLIMGNPVHPLECPGCPGWSFGKTECPTCMLWQSQDGDGARPEMTEAMKKRQAARRAQAAEAARKAAEARAAYSS